MKTTCHLCRRSFTSEPIRVSALGIVLSLKQLACDDCINRRYESGAKKLTKTENKHLRGDRCGNLYPLS